MRSWLKLCPRHGCLSLQMWVTSWLWGLGSWEVQTRSSWIGRIYSGTVYYATVIVHIDTAKRPCQFEENQLQHQCPTFGFLFASWCWQCHETGQSQGWLWVQGFSTCSKTGSWSWTIQTPQSCHAGAWFWCPSKPIGCYSDFFALRFLFKMLNQFYGANNIKVKHIKALWWWRWWWW